MLPFVESYKPCLSKACRRYLRKVNKCNSKKQLMDVILDINAIAFLAPIVADGTIAADELARTFPNFINGQYIRDIDNYTSAIYIGLPRVQVSTTAALIIDCDEVLIPFFHPCELHIVSRNNSTKISSPESANIYWYNHK